MVETREKERRNRWGNPKTINPLWGRGLKKLSYVSAKHIQDAAVVNTTIILRDGIISGNTLRLPVNKVRQIIGTQLIKLSLRAGYEGPGIIEPPDLIADTRSGLAL